MQASHRNHAPRIVAGSQALINHICTYFSDHFKADVLVDIECDARNLDQVIRMLQREVHSVTYATNISGEEVVPMTPLSASFGKKK